MIVFAADLHLSPTIWSSLPDVRGDAYYAWNQIVSHCADKSNGALGVKSLILGGDVFDKRNPDSKSVGCFLEGIDRLDSAGVRVFVIQGQHDRSVPPWAELHEWVEYIGDGKPINIPLDDTHEVCVAGFDNMPGDALEAALSEVPPEVEMLVLHQLYRGTVGTFDFDHAWVPPTVKTVLMGDYHETLDWQIERESGPLCLYYPGSTHMRSITEPMRKHWLNVHKVDQVTPYPLLARERLDFNISTEEELEAAIAAVRAYVPVVSVQPGNQPMVYARFGSGIPAAPGRLRAVCEEEADHGQRAFMLERAMSEGTEVVLPDVDDLEDVSLESCLAQAVDAEQDADLYAFALSLLRSPDPASELTALKERMGIGTATG